jgi:hypothetical protein
LAGTEIQYMPEERNMRINGRIYDNVADFDILRRNKFVVPYNEVEAEELKSTAQPLQRPNEDPVKSEKMPIVKSDEDEMQDPIDIRSTQIANRVKEVKATNHKDAVEKMEVIRGDETPKERRDRLADIENKKMAIVEDDGSLSGESLGGKPLNEGLVKERTAEEVDRLRQAAKVKPIVVEENDNSLADEVLVAPPSKSPTDAVDDFEIKRIPVTDDDLAKQINEANV